MSIILNMATFINRREVVRDIAAVGLGYFIRRIPLADTGRIYIPEHVQEWPIGDELAGEKVLVGTMKLNLNGGILGPDGSLGVYMFDRFFENSLNRKELSVDLGSTLKVFRLNFDYENPVNVVIKARMEEGDINDRSCIRAELGNIKPLNSRHLWVRWEDLEIREVYFNGQAVNTSPNCEWPRFSLIPPIAPFLP